MIFLKPSTLGDRRRATRSGCRPSSSEVHYEGELAVVIGRPARNVSRDDALDVRPRLRLRQRRHRARPAARGRASSPARRATTRSARSGRGSRPCSTRPTCAWSRRVNGEIKQDGRTSQMIHDIPTQIAFMSGVMTLLPGDVILTGTPAGVGPIVAGDTVSVEIEGIGTLTNPVRARDDALRRGCASRRRRPATRTSARPTCRCSTSASRGGTAASSCCASRTPTARGSRPTASSRSTTRCTGSGWTGTRGPDIGGPYAPYRQSERLDTYRPFVEQLLADGHAYRCWCTPGAAGRDARAAARREAADRLRPAVPRQDRARSARRWAGSTDTPVVRMLIPDDAPLTFTDLIRGEVSAPRPDDQVILKADGFPTYHLAVVVDDHLMGITHVVRGEEWISSTPKHLLLYRWLGFDDARVRAHAAAAQRRQVQDLQAQEPGRAADLVRRAGLPARGAAQLPGAARLRPARRVRRSSPSTQFSASFEWSRVNTVGPVFDLDEARLAQRPLHPRAGRRRVRAPAGRASSRESRLPRPTPR